MILAVCVIAGATVLMLALYAWSARRIEAIHRKGLDSLRQIQREFSREQGRNG